MIDALSNSVEAMNRSMEEINKIAERISNPDTSTENLAEDLVELKVYQRQYESQIVVVKTIDEVYKRLVDAMA